MPWGELRRHRVGLWTRIARPARVVASLADCSVFPVVQVAKADHARLTARELRELSRVGQEKGVTLWLCTGKCSVRLPARLGDVPVGILQHDVALDEPLQRELEQAARGR
jgi:tetraacyldisaccharide-1-P 4'-kinase